jgi:hypothetical protein
MQHSVSNPGQQELSLTPYLHIYALETKVVCSATERQFHNRNSVLLCSEAIVWAKGVKQQLAYLPRFRRDGWMMGDGQETLFHWVPVHYLNSTRVYSISVFITYLLTMHYALSYVVNIDHHKNTPHFAAVHTKGT